jgi:hypothetical protein
MGNFATSIVPSIRKRPRPELPGRDPGPDVVGNGRKRLTPVWTILRKIADDI